jgi:hypothetical protein
VDPEQGWLAPLGSLMRPGQWTFVSGRTIPYWSTARAVMTLKLEPGGQALAIAPFSIGLVGSLSRRAKSSSLSEVENSWLS